MVSEKKKHLSSLSTSGVSSALQAARENAFFLCEALREFQSTGAPFPTSRWAAQKLINPLRSRDARKPLRILELGPGTGSVTTHILEHVQPGDELVLCEINPRFLQMLKEKLSTNKDFQRVKDGVKFYGCPMQELPEDGRPFDVIICAIPFLNFDVETIHEMFAKLRRLSDDRTIMTYYEFIGLRSLGKVVSPSKRRARLKRVDSFFRALYPGHLVDKAKVYLNVLPINVYVLKALHRLPVLA